MKFRISIDNTETGKAPVEFAFDSTEAVEAFLSGLKQNAPTRRRRKASAAKAKPAKQAVSNKE